jgi:hypothetical protein
MAGLVPAIHVVLSVIASEAKQSTDARNTIEMDCFVAIARRKRRA